MKLLPLPMFGRIFIALLVMTISALILIAATFSDYQERVTALTLAPMWAAAIRTEQEQPGAPRRELDLRMRITFSAGAPPAQAYSIASDRRTVALTDALAQSGISVIDTKLDDTSELPVTWLQVQPPQGEARWVGLTGGVQPSIVSYARIGRARRADSGDYRRGVVYEPLGGAPDGASFESGRRDRPWRSADGNRARYARDRKARDWR